MNESDNAVILIWHAVGLSLADLWAQRMHATTAGSNFYGRLKDYGIRHRPCYLISKLISIILKFQRVQVSFLLSEVSCYKALQPRREVFCYLNKDFASSAIRSREQTK